MTSLTLRGDLESRRNRRRRVSSANALWICRRSDMEGKIPEISRKVKYQDLLIFNAQASLNVAPDTLSCRSLLCDSESRTQSLVALAIARTSLCASGSADPDTSTGLQPRCRPGSVVSVGEVRQQPECPRATPGRAPAADRHTVAALATHKGKRTPRRSGLKSNFVIASGGIQFQGHVARFGGCLQ